MSNIDDKELARRVKDTLDTDPGMRAYGLQVDSNGGEVVVQGIVDVLREKQRVSEIVSAIPGVKSVENAVTMSTDGSVTDSETTKEVLEEFQADPRINTRDIGVEVSGGTAVLMGFADSRTDIEAAKEAASKALGVKNVVSNIKTSE